MRVRSKRARRLVGPLKVVSFLLVVLAVLIMGYRGNASNPGVTPEFVVPDPGSVSVPITVSGVSTPITSMQVRINGFTAPRADDMDMLLVAPDGTHNLEFMSDAGTTSPVGPIDFTLVDGGAQGNVPDAAALTNGSSYSPGDYSLLEPGGTFPGFAGTINHAQTNGSSTFASAFGAASGLVSANGTWTLIIVDDASSADGGTTITQVQLIINGTTVADSSVSGRIAANDGSPVEGAVVNLSGSQNRMTITDSSGNYRFAGVETNGFYAVTPSRVNYGFTPAQRSFTVTGNNTDASFNGSFMGDAANPADTTEYFVRQQYLDFLGREPEEGGLAYWSDRIRGCGTDAACISQRRIEVSAAFFASVEFQQTGSYVYGMYAGTLGRTLNYGEFSADRSQLLGGAGLDEAKTAFAQAFVQRPEFTSRYPQGMTRDQFVDAVIQTMQVRTGTSMNQYRGGFLADYDAGGRALVVQHAAEASDLVATEYNEAFVLMEYFGYLRRDVDPGGYGFWLDVLNRAPGGYPGMVCSFLTSTEYQRRFSTVVTHSNAECRQ